jgi:hypothetical protein
MSSMRARTGPLFRLMMLTDFRIPIYQPKGLKMRKLAKSFIALLAIFCISASAGNAVAKYYYDCCFPPGCLGPTCPTGTFEDQGGLCSTCVANSGIFHGICAVNPNGSLTCAPATTCNGTCGGTPTGSVCSFSDGNPC